MPSLGLFKESSYSSPKRFESLYSANLARFLYSLLTPGNKNIWFFDCRLWVACRDILIPSTDIWMASNFSSLRSSFVFKISVRWGSSFIEQLLFWHIALKFLEFYFCTIFWQRCKSKSNRIYKFCFNRFLSAVSERVSLKTTYTTMDSYSDVSSPSFHWFDDRIQIIVWRLSPSMGSCCDLPTAVTEDVEVSWWDRKNAAKLVSL